MPFARFRLWDATVLIQSHATGNRSGSFGCGLCLLHIHPTREAPVAQVRKKTNQTTPRIRTASPVETVKSASTDGPGSA